LGELDGPVPRLTAELRQFAGKGADQCGASTASNCSPIQAARVVAQPIIAPW
jgi:hypothetical protein